MSSLLTSSITLLNDPEFAVRIRDVRTGHAVIRDDGVFAAGDSVLPKTRGNRHFRDLDKMQGGRIKLS